jgi:hypothetical protein
MTGTDQHGERPMHEPDADPARNGHEKGTVQARLRHGSGTVFTARNATTRSRARTCAASRILFSTTAPAESAFGRMAIVSGSMNEISADAHGHPAEPAGAGF